VDEQKQGWRKLRELRIDKKKLSRRMKKAEVHTTRHAHRFIIKRLDNIRSVRRHIISWLLLVGVLILAVGAQFVWFQRSYQTTAAAAGGTYAEGSLGPIDTLNPLYASSSAEMAAARLMFSSLYQYDETGNLQGDLARQITTDDSGKVYTVKIRSDARWHDGMQLTAQDIAFTVNLIKDPETRSPLRINWQDIKVEAVDDTTVKFTLPAVYAAFPHALTFSVVPRHVLKDVEPGAVRENTYSQAPVGSGPFQFRLLQNASSIDTTYKIVHMIANELYYQGAPMLNRFEVHAYQSSEDILRALRTGQVTAAANLTGADISQVDTNVYNVATQPIDSGVYALFNMEAPAVKDKTIRQALQLGTDTAAIRQVLSEKVGALDSPFIQGQLTGDGVPKAPTPDTKKAAQMLDSAGWKMTDGVRVKDGRKLEITVATTKNSQYEETLEALAGQWRKLGVSVLTNVVDINDPSVNFVQNILQPRNYDVLLYELSIGADPDVYAYWHSSQIGARGYNFSNYANGIADDALSSARSRLEPELRNAKYKAFAQQWLSDVPAIGLYQAVAEYAYNKNVRSINSDAHLVTPYGRFENILWWSVNERSVYKTP
jgi:peptide/nickel transport system substrate-binding protein